MEERHSRGIWDMKKRQLLPEISSTGENNILASPFILLFNFLPMNLMVSQKPFGKGAWEI